MGSASLPLVPEGQGSPSPDRADAVCESRGCDSKAAGWSASRLMPHVPVGSSSSALRPLF